MMRMTIFVLVLLMTGCIRTDNCRGLYSFEVPVVTNYPAGQLSIGDTLSITMLTDNTMLVDTYIEGRTVNFPHFDPFMDFYLVSLDSLPIVDGFDVHDIVVHAGNETTLVNGSELSDFLVFSQINAGEIESKLGFDIIVKEKGTYVIYAYNLLDYIDSRDFLDFPDRCGGRCCSSLLAKASFNSGNDNAHLLTEMQRDIEDEYWKVYQPSRDLFVPFYFTVE